MAISLEKFTRSLSDSNILSAQDVATLQLALKPADAMQFAKALVKQATLTKYQAEQILSGKANSLVLGNYVILEKIGQGGMGQVLKARHRRMDRTVALKILSPNVTKTPDALQRFQREVRAAAKLEHPNIVTAHDADEANGTHFFVMQYVDGRDLAGFIRSQGRMTVPRAVHCLDQAARGLQYAHERGIVHRDIKPANLLLSHDDQLKILDLGLATMADNDGVVDHGLTGTGAIMGTVDFMAPEQGVNTKRADARSDIYSLGCTFYYLLTGQVPFSGETAVEKILAHRDQPIPDLGKQRPDLPAPLLQMFQRMVAKEPADRYQTMGEVLAALRTVSAAASTVIQPAGGSAPFDPALQKFFDAQGATDTKQRALAVTVMQPEPAVQTPAADTLNAASVHTDSLLTKRQTKTRTLQAPAGVRPPANVRRWLMAAGSGLGGLLLCGIIIITITNKDGKQTTIKVPDGVEIDVEAAPGSTVKITQQNDGPSSSPSTSNTTGWHGWPADAPTPAIAPFNAEQAKQHQEAWAKYLQIDVASKHSIGTKFVLIPPGEFLMGVTENQIATTLEMTGECSQIDFMRTRERPQHRVTITRPFLLGATEVTVREFRKFVVATNYVTDAEKYGSTESGDTTPPEIPPETLMTWRATQELDLPVVNISWNDAMAYCQWLSHGENVTYRLPTEAEWEYSCRAGTETLFPFGDDLGKVSEYAWYQDTADKRLHRVGTKLPNAFGMHDMHGNVTELTQDYLDPGGYHPGEALDPIGATTGDLRVAKGGCFPYNALSMRSTGRWPVLQAFRCNRYGFRVVRTLDFPLTASGMAQYSPYTAPAPPDYATERAAAEWVLSVGGKVTLINWKGETRDLTKGPVPAGEWELQVVELGNCQKVRDDDLWQFAKCRRLSRLNLTNIPLTGAGLKYLKDLSSLRDLVLSGTKLTDETAVLLAPLQQLSHLSLGSCPELTDRSMIPVGQLKELETLELGAFERLTDAGAAHLNGLTRLRHLGLPATQITDAGLAALVAQNPQLDGIAVGPCANGTAFHSLAPLAKATGLKFAMVSGDLLTEAGVPVLQGLSQLNHLAIAWPVTTAAVERSVALTNVPELQLYVLFDFDPGPGDAGYAALAQHPTVTEVIFVGSGQSPTDAALASLAKLPKLQTLRLDPWSPPNYTPAGIEAFRKARPDVHLFVKGTDNPPTTGSNAPPDYTAERAAAEWAINLKAGVDIMSDDIKVNLTDLNQIPETPFTVYSLVFAGQPNLTSDDFALIAPLKGLKYLYLNSTQVDDSSMTAIGRMTHLSHLNLLGTQLTDDGLSELVGLKNLEVLWVQFTNVSDEGMDSVAQLKNLRELHLGETAVGNAGLAKLTRLKQLESFSPGVAVTAQGLKQLASFPKLKLVGLKTHQFTEQSVTYLQRLPELETLDLVGATDADVALMKSLTNVKWLGLNMNQFTTQGFLALQELSHVKTLNLSHNTNINDENVVPVTKMVGLKRLYISGANVTLAGIAAFRKARPDVQLNVDGKDYPALADGQ